MSVSGCVDPLNTSTVRYPICRPPRISVSMVSPIMVTSLVRRLSCLRAMRIMMGLGLPTLKAFIPEAASSMATMAPQPGRMPLSVGQLGSMLVAMSLAPLRMSCSAFSAISNVRVRPSPMTT